MASDKKNGRSAADSKAILEAQMALAADQVRIRVFGACFVDIPETDRILFQNWKASPFEHF
jgi:hypothetical protein